MLPRIIKNLSLCMLLCLAVSNCSLKSNATETGSPITQPTPAGSYEQKIAGVSEQRIRLSSEYRASAAPAGKKASVDKARKLFIESINNGLFPFWYGTEWDFYGTTEKPKDGKIACGYFVTTVLRDAGLKVERAPLAQQASENIIKSLTFAQHIKRYHNAPIEKFVEGVRSNGEGLYIVGLDFHVGFILNDGGEVYFIHSSYAEPKVVLKEKALESAVLASSKYRVTGKISADDALILKWLNQTKIPTIRR